ncbi:GXWXG domain-containing protein, partial [Marimonas sp. MJW-29]
DTLGTVSVEEMLGRWRGEGIDTGHDLDGMLEAARWHGKDYERPDEGFPQVHYGPFAGRYCINPAQLPIRLCAPLPAKSDLFNL